MKIRSFTGGLMAASVLLALPVVAVTSVGHVGTPFPVADGNPVGGFSDLVVSGAGPILTDIQVSLSLSGGYNGDLYAYLSHGGRLLPLLNRIGVSAGSPFGSSGAGMQITLVDTASLNVHSAGDGFLVGTYRPDGQNVGPMSAPNTFAPLGGDMTLMGMFGDVDPNGPWTLFVADVVVGGGPSLVNSWSLTFWTVPEPSFAALMICGLALAFQSRSSRGIK